jgi:hypothetical protein
MIKNTWPSLMRPDSLWKFSFPTCRFMQHSTAIPPCCFSSHSPQHSTLLCHPPYPNLALWNNCLIIHSLMFLKHSVLARIMRHFGGRLSFPQFVVLMTINTFTIPTNLPFHFWYHLPLPGPQSSRSTILFWTPILICPIISHFPIISTTLLVNLPPFWLLGTSSHMVTSARTFQDASSHHSVPIYDRYVDNVMTLYRLRRRSGHPPDYTMYMYHTLCCSKLVITTKISGSDKYQQGVSVVWGGVSESRMEATASVLQSQVWSEPEGYDHKQNTKKCVGSNREIDFGVKSDMNCGRLEVKLTRQKAGGLWMKRFEVRQKIRMKIGG